MLSISSCLFAQLLTHFSLFLHEVGVGDYPLLGLLNFLRPFPNGAGMGAWSCRKDQLSQAFAKREYGRQGPSSMIVHKFGFLNVKEATSVLVKPLLFGLC